MFSDTLWLYLGLYVVGIVISLRFYKKNRKQYKFLIIAFSLFILWTIIFRFSSRLNSSLLMSNPTSDVRYLLETVIDPITSLIDIAGWIMLLIAISQPPSVANTENSDTAFSLVKTVTHSEATNYRTCLKCHQSNEKDAIVCISCGAEL